MRKHQYIRYLLLPTAILLVAFSIVYTNRLVKQLGIEERKKIELWADALKQLIQSDNNTDVSFIYTIIEGNTTIPVCILDSNDNPIEEPRNIVGYNEMTERQQKRCIARLKSAHGPILVPIDTQLTHYIYYDDSILLKQLRYFPYIQLTLIVVFVFVVFAAYASAKRAEQERVWVGLSKETAHQLGTPISSLIAWIELLKNQYPDDQLIPEMEHDTDRLQMVAERFSKIGSKPELKECDLVEVLQQVINYMRTRTSSHINYQFKTHLDSVILQLNRPLFSWAVENLCKNAVDAMTGSGQLTIELFQVQDEFIIDVTDTGKGIDKKNLNDVFKPGYTTKKHGWGLGLSLTRRIIEEYHRGKIFVKQSKVDIGTTFRIIMH